MKSLLTLLFIVTLYLPTAMSQISDSLSYSLGVMIAKNLEQQGFSDLNLDELKQAMADVQSGRAQVDPAKAQQIIQAEAQKAAMAKHAVAKEAGEAFLAENGKRPEVKSLPSGLQYEVMTEGTGPVPSASDKVTTHYHGMLIDGKVFDSSVNRGEPATFPVGGVIQGWQEILQLMPVGSKYKVFIPYNLAYGERGAGADIPPFSALIFEIELLEIN